MRDIELLAKHGWILFIVIFGVLIILGYVLALLGYPIFMVIFSVSMVIAFCMCYSLEFTYLTKKMEEYDPTVEPGISRVEAPESEKSKDKGNGDDPSKE